MLGKLVVINDTLNRKKMKYTQNPFYRKEKSGRQVLKNV